MNKAAFAGVAAYLLSMAGDSMRTWTPSPR